MALAVNDARAAAVSEQFRTWLNDNEDVHAPGLLPYEVANALTRLIVAGMFPADQDEEAWRRLSAVPVAYHDFTDASQIIDIALRLRRQSAYDAAYLALARQLGAELWTFDGPLARNANSIGFTVNLIA